MKGISAIVFLSLAAAAIGINPLKSWKLCKRSDPKIDECLRDACQKAIRGLKTGNKEFGLIALEPLHYDEIVFDHSQSKGPIAIHLKFRNIDLLNLASSLKIGKFISDWKNWVFETDVYMENPHQLIVLGDYEIDGKILILPITGKGKCNITLDNFSAKVISKGKEMVKDGVKYLDFPEVTVNIETSQMHLQLDNLFNGDAALGQNMNLVLNENWSDLLKELGPSIAKAISATYKKMINNVFHQVPIDVLSPP